MSPTPKILRFVNVLNLQSIKRLLSADGVAIPKTKGFGVSRSSYLNAYLSHVNSISNPMGESVTCQSLPGGKYLLHYVASVESHHIGSGYYRSIDPATGRMRLLVVRRNGASAGGSSAPVPEEGTDSSQVSDDLAAPDMSSPYNVAEEAVPASTAAPQEELTPRTERAAGVKIAQIAAIPLLNNSRSLEEKGIFNITSVIGTQSPETVSYAIIDWEAMVATPECKIIYHMNSYRKGDETRGKDFYVRGLFIDGKPATPAEYVAANGIGDLSYNEYMGTTRAVTQSGTNVQSLVECQQKVLDELATKTRVRPERWHKAYIDIKQYTPVPNATHEPAALTPLSVESLPTGFTIDKLDKPGGDKVLNYELGISLALAVTFPATFPKLVDLWNTFPKERVVIDKQTGRATSQPTAAFTSRCVQIRNSMIDSIKLLKEAGSSNDVFVFLRALLAFSRSTGNQQDRFNYGLRDEDIPALKALMSAIGSVNASVNNFNNDLEKELTGAERSQLVALIDTCVSTLIRDNDILYISSINFSDLAMNIQQGIQKEKAGQPNPSLKSQLLRRFMIAYRASLLIIAEYNRPVFEAIKAGK